MVALLASGLMLTAPSSAQLSGNIITIGDSITAGLAGSASGRITCAALGGAQVAADRQRDCRGNGQRNIGGWQPQLANATGVSVFNFGNSGEVTAEMLARINQHLAAQPSQFVLILGGTNDAIFDTPTGTTMANLNAMISAVRASQRTPIIGTLSPLIGGNERISSRNAQVLILNALIRALPDIEVADHYAALVDNWGQNTSGDFIHLGPIGNQIVANTWLDAINQSITSSTSNDTVLAPITNLLLSDD